MVVWAIIRADASIVLNQGMLFLIIIFVGFLIEMIHTKRQNRRREAAFLAGQMTKTDSRPTKL